MKNKYLNTNVVIDNKGSPQNSVVSGVNMVQDRQMRNWILGYRQFPFSKPPDSFCGPHKPRSQRRPDSLPAGANWTLLETHHLTLSSTEDNNERSHISTIVNAFMG